MITSGGLPKRRTDRATAADDRAGGGRRCRAGSPHRGAGDYPARDEEAELCRRYTRRLVAFGRRHLGSGDQGRDLAQDTLLLTIEKLCAGRVREPERIRAFIYAEQSSSDIATSLGLSSENVRVIRHRSVARLRDCFGLEGGTP